MGKLKYTSEPLALGRRGHTQKAAGIPRTGGSSDAAKVSFVVLYSLERIGPNQVTIMPIL